MDTFLLNFSYPGILFLLLLAGLGAPIPEDIPLLLGGYLCATRADGQAFAQLYLMIPLTLLAVLAGDCSLYCLGRRYGHHVPRLPLLRRFLDSAQLERAQQAFCKHGGKTLFIGRFLPGLRAPIFFTAGTFKIPMWKLFAFDGSAALISVPAFVLLGWFFADRIDMVKQLSLKVQMLLLIGLVIAFGLYILTTRWLRYRPAPGSLHTDVNKSQPPTMAMQTKRI